MKCYSHPKEDAVAVCKICGKGVCNNCLITIASISYCKSCVEAGRVKLPIAPTVAVPKPTGTPTRAPFIVGAIGAISSGFAALLTMIFGGLLFAVLLYGVRYGPSYDMRMSIGGIITGIILAIGLILAGIGYLGLRRNYGAGTGAAGFAFSIIVCVFIFASVVFDMIALGYRGPYPWRDPWYVIYILSAGFTLLLFGVTQVLWGAAHIRTRKFTGKSGLSMATGIMLIISGALTMSVVLTFIGIMLFLISEILATIAFMMSRIPQRGTQTP